MVVYAPDWLRFLAFVAEWLRGVEVSAGRRYLASIVAAIGFSLAITIGGSATADSGSTVEITVPYLGEVPAQLPEGWVPSECPQGRGPDLVQVRCDGGQVTFVGSGYSPGIAPQDVVIASTTPSGTVQTVVYVVTLQPPRLSGPPTRTYGFPLSQGVWTTIPFSELRYDCEACTTESPAFIAPTVSPEDAGIVRFSGLGLVFGPAPGFVGDAVVSFRLRDAFGQETDTAQLTLMVVAGPSMAPVSVPDQVHTEVDVPVSGNVLENDTKISAVTALVTACERPLNGVVECQPDGSFVYKPRLGFVGLDQFSYHIVTESTGDQAVGSVTIGVGVTLDAFSSQPDGTEIIPMFAPSARVASMVTPGVLAMFRDATAEIPRGPAG